MPATTATAAISVTISGTPRVFYALPELIPVGKPQAHAQHAELDGGEEREHPPGQGTRQSKLSTRPCDPKLMLNGAIRIRNETYNFLPKPQNPVYMG